MWLADHVWVRRQCSMRSEDFTGSFSVRHRTHYVDFR